MANYETNKNRSAYCDPTASMGLSGYGAKPGEIWESKRHEDEQYLIIKNHGTFSSVLLLRETGMPGTVEVVSRQKMYTQPQLVSYSHNNNLGDYVKKLPQPAFLEIVRMIEDALDLSLCPEIIPDNKAEQDEIRALKAHIKELEEKEPATNPENLTRVAEIELLWAQAQICRDMYDDLISKIVGKKVE